MSKSRAKPQGKSGPIRAGSLGSGWLVIPFPKDKAEREQLVAKLFVNAFDEWVATESAPSLAPFGQPKQNQENDIDFSVETSVGPMLMELAEFAPLEVYGPRFEDAPKSLQFRAKAELAVGLVRDKSGHQGGKNRFLVIYNTEQGFWLDPPSIELMRRTFIQEAPNFERVYYISIHDLESASVSEIYPGKPHHIFGDANLDDYRISTPHPTEFTEVRSVTWQQGIVIGGKISQANFTVNYYDFYPLREIAADDSGLVSPE